MAKLDELRAENPGLFASLVAQPSPFEAQINRDISRTFPTHIMFRESGGMGYVKPVLGERCFPHLM
jgi:hypothetical protein